MGEGGDDFEREPWYFGKISRDDADRLLMNGSEGEFLVRESESNPGDLSISMRGHDRNKHFKVSNIIIIIFICLFRYKLSMDNYESAHDPFLI